MQKVHVEGAAGSTLVQGTRAENLGFFQWILIDVHETTLLVTGTQHTVLFRPMLAHATLKVLRLGRAGALVSFDEPGWPLHHL